MEHKLSKIIPIQFLIIITVLLVPNSFSTAKWIICWIFLFIILRVANLISPITWLMTIWNIIFINAYSGILIYNSPIDFFALLYILLTIVIFSVGYFLPKNNKRLEIQNKFNEELNKREYTIIKIFSYLSILGGFFIFFDIILISGGNLNNFSALRLLIATRDVSIFGQLAAIFLSGGFISLTTLFLFQYKKQNILMLSIFSLALASFFSAGRQTIFQIFIITILLYLLKYKYKIKTKFSLITKISAIALLVTTIIYLVVLSVTRDITSMNKNKMLGYTQINDLSYSPDFLYFTSNLPIGATNLMADFTFYFSQEIVTYSDAFINEDYPLVNIDFLEFFPFFERQLSKLGLRQNTLELRMKNAYKRKYKSSVFTSGWGTSTSYLLKCFGYLGGLLVVFIHGLTSKYIYIRFSNNPGFYTIFALISNNIILFYTAITPVTQETSFMFFMFISFSFLFFKNYRNNNIDLPISNSQIS